MIISLVAVGYGQLIGVLVGLFVVSVFYALALEYSERHWGFVSAYTWLTVVIGVGYTLAGLALLSLEAAVLALFVFAASAIPIVARSIINDLRERNELRDHLEDR
jgi:hypothetical protein